MAAPERAVCDQDVRDRVTGDLGTTFLLEAGAGTGKTRVLVDRYVKCVLDDELGAGDVRRSPPSPSPRRRPASCASACARSSRRAPPRPRRAPPRRTPSSAPSRRSTTRPSAPSTASPGACCASSRWRPASTRPSSSSTRSAPTSSAPACGRSGSAMLAAGDASAEAAEGGPGRRVRDWLSRLLRVGVRLDDVRELAVGAKGVFGERYDLDPAPEPPAGARPRRGPRPRSRRRSASLRDFCARACTDQADNGFVAAMDLVEACEALLAEPPADLDLLAAALLALAGEDHRHGARRQQGQLGRGRRRQGRAADALPGARSPSILGLRDAYAEYVTGLAVAVADAFARWAGHVQVGLGLLDFTDLLGRLRDLLAATSLRAAPSSSASATCSSTSSRTPIRCRPRSSSCSASASRWPPTGAMWSSSPASSSWSATPSSPSTASGAPTSRCTTRSRGWSAASPAAPASSRPSARTSARRRPRWSGSTTCSPTCSTATQAEGRQPGYQWVEAYRPPADGPRVAVLLGREYGDAAGEADAARRDEARALAALLLRMHGPDAARWYGPGQGIAAVGADAAQRAPRGASPEGEPARPPRWGDVALLFRATTGLETYEQALREAGVPYRVDGGKTYFARREVADALLCLRAADDAADGPALYGALHSSFFGFSDDDLFLFWAAGGRFDLFAAGQPPGHEAIVAALGTLRALHERRVEWEPHEMAAELVRLAHGTEFLAATGAGASQAIANLEKLVERARAFSGAGGGGLGAFLAWAAEAGDAAGEGESQVDDEGDVVHLLTIHKAKGLEYPIVVLVGGALGGGGRGGEPIVDRARSPPGRQAQGRASRGGRARSRAPAYTGPQRAREEDGRERGAAAALRGRDARPRPPRRVVLRQADDGEGRAGGRAARRRSPGRCRRRRPRRRREDCEAGRPARAAAGEPPERGEPEAAPDAATMIAARGAWLARARGAARGSVAARRGPPARAASSTSTRRCAAAARRAARPRPRAGAGLGRASRHGALRPGRRVVAARRRRGRHARGRSAGPGRARGRARRRLLARGAGARGRGAARRSTASCPSARSWTAPS